MNTVKSDLRLAFLLAKRDLKNRYASSFFGAAWNIGVPLLNAIVSVTVFSILIGSKMGQQYNDVPFSVFYFVPFSLWLLFPEVAGRSTSILREYSYLINKIAFPVWVLPLIPFASALLSQLVIILITLSIIIISGVTISDNYIMFPVIWIFSIITAIGISYFVSSVSAYIPDMSQLIPFILNVIFWLTPILYMPSIIRGHDFELVKNIIMNFNPFYYIVESARFAIIGSDHFDFKFMYIIAIFSLLTLAIGVIAFRKLKPGFADVL